MQAFTKNSGSMPCPPHGPFLVFAVKESSYVTKCVACGLQGPEREDSEEATQAIGQARMPGELRGRFD